MQMLNQIAQSGWGDVKLTLSVIFFILFAVFAEYM